MKKFLNILTIVLIFMCTCFVFIGCNDRYADLRMSLVFSFDPNGENVEVLDDGSYRVTTNTGVFDARIDGSYIMYIEENGSSSATLNITYTGMPSDFNYSVGFSSTNEFAVSVNSNVRNIENGIQATIVASQEGQSDIKVTNLESGLSSTVHIEVVEVASDISFKNENLALAKIEQNSIDFTQEINGVLSNLDNVTFEFGLGLGEEFVPFTDVELLAEGFSYNRSTRTLTLERTDVSLNALIVRATYDSPLGDDKETFASIRILSDIKNFEIFAGSSVEDTTTENKITQDDIIDFVVNMTGLNYIDVVLKVESNGEKVVFGLIEDELSPFGDLESQPSYTQNCYEYYDENGSKVESFENAVTTYAYFRLTAFQRTNNEEYYEDNIYSLLFTCNYADYIVSGYPLEQSIVSNCYNLITKFSINGETMEGLTFDSQNIESIFAAYSSEFYDKKNIYLDTSSDVLGESFSVDIAEPISINKEDSRFLLEFYDEHLNLILHPEDYLSLIYESEGIRQNLDGVDFNTRTFDPNSIFYVKPNDDMVMENQIYYMVIRAEKPDTAQTVAVIKLTVKQGIREISSYNFTYYRYQIDENGNYVYDENNKKIIIEEKVNNVTFEDSTTSNSIKIGSEEINIDLDVNRPANVELNFLPEDAVLDNLSIVSQNTGIVEIERLYDGSFIVNPRGVGSTSIELSASNLSTIYVINVNVYRPINAFYVMLNQTGVENGVGEHIISSDDGLSTQSATVQAGTGFSFSVVTMPSRTTSYEMHYSVYLVGSEDKLIGSYITGNENDIIEDLGYFSFDAGRNSFSFQSDSAVGREYKIVMEIHNLNGVILRKEIRVSCYVPVSSIMVLSTTKQVAESSSIYYLDKITTSEDMSGTDTITDPSVFGISVSINAGSDRLPTFSFNDYGRISLYINNNLDSRYDVVDGYLIQNYKSSSSVIDLISNALINGEYWFRLNENYNLSNGTIVVSAQVEELGAHTAADDEIINILNVEEVSRISTGDSTEINFRQGLNNSTSVNIELFDENIYNNALLGAIFAILEIDGQRLYVLADSQSEVLQLNLSLERKNLYNVNLGISSDYSGSAVIIVMPEDKINSEQEYLAWTNFKYTQIDISKENFVSGLYYYIQNSNFVLATEYDESTNYYVRQVNIQDMVSIWDGCAVLNVTVSNGEDIPYHISSLEELLEIGENEESSSKNYVLTRDITLDNNYNWQSIGNYYNVILTEEEFNLDTFYVKNESGEYVVQDTYNQDMEYYGFGFNGNLSGRYVLFDNKTQSEIVRYYGIYNIRYEGREDDELVGIISKLGIHGSITDLTVEYNYFQPNSNIQAVYGGIVGENNGNIENVSLQFSDYRISSSEYVVVGGIAGRNYGSIKNTQISTKSGLQGTINVVIQVQDIDAAIGGLVGENFGEIEGSFDTTQEIQYTFNDIGFDSSLALIVEGSSLNTRIGGVAGYNEGRVINVAVQGRIIANNSDNVGGLVGYNVYNEKYNSSDNYSIQSSYSIAIVQGHNNVGGAVGYSAGVDNNSHVKIYNISAENYATSTNNSRTFVKGNENIGGLIGRAEYTDVQFSYAVSYFNCDMVEGDNKTEDYNYDVVGVRLVGGFIGLARSSSINVSASYINVKGDNNISTFIGLIPTGVTILDVFTIGSVFGSTSVLNGFSSSATNSYSIVYNVSSELTFVNGSALASTDSINVSGEHWQVDENINDGLPYLVFEDKEALLATTPITISAIVKENDKYTSYIKNGNSSLVLFYGYDEYGRYSTSTMNQVNTVKLEDLINLQVFAETHKTARFNVRSSNLQVLTISNNGDIRIVGEGRATITISSKLNSEFNVSIDIVVINGLTGMQVYANPSMTMNVDGETLELINSQNLTLYTETEYKRNVDGEEIDLVSTTDVGLRFKVQNDENLANLLAEINTNESGTTYTLNDILRIDNSIWTLDREGNFYYIDVASASSVSLMPLVAFEGNLALSYVPFIRKEFNLGLSTVLLDKFGDTVFNVTINNGASAIILENNIDSNIEINQLENFVFTVTVITDYEEEDIISNIDTIQDEFLGFTPGTLTYNRNEHGELESVSRTYTIWYKDKINPIDGQKVYELEFWPLSNSNITNRKRVTINIVGQDGVNDIAGQIFSNIKEDFPQKPSADNIVYNGDSALFSLEVYPYFANYSKLRLSYTSLANYPLTISQLYYNISGTGEEFSPYADSGAIVDSSGALIIEKSSGQDTYLVNTGGIYSYSKSYFFGLLVASDVPDRTQYVITVEVLDRFGSIIVSRSFTFTTLAKSEMGLSFNDVLLGEDNLYYLPVNTEQELSLVTTNEYENIYWQVDSPDYELSTAEKNIFMPEYRDGSYYVSIMDYENNLFNTNLIGKTIELTATLDDSTTDPYTVSFVISLFSVIDVQARGVSKGYMTLANSVTTPLNVDVEVVYDESLSQSEDNWYTEWYQNFGNDADDLLYQNIIASGYEIEEYFVNYFSQLEEAISKANYSLTDEGSSKTSGVFLYIDSQGTLNPLRAGRTYNNGVFGVESYNDYISVFGYQVDRNSDIRFSVRLSYSHVDNTTMQYDGRGIPNVQGYSYDLSLYAGVFTYSQDFTLTFVNRIDLNNPIPVSSAEEFLKLATEDGGYYRLVNDIELSSYTPININVDSFDGNNYTIYITSFAMPSEENPEISLGLFNTVGEETMVYNTSVYYTNRVDISPTTGEYIPRANPLSISISQASSVKFGGIVVINNGIVTNCSVSGSLTLSLPVNSGVDSIAEVLNGGLVAENNSSGYITNSKINNFILTCSGETGGFVGINNGMIVSSYFDNSQISNLSSANIGGFVLENNGSIYECFSQGARAQTDRDIRNTGSGIGSYGGEIGGFAYLNNAIISDSYSNIWISTSSSMAGFVYQDTSSSIISRCYSISYKRPGDNNTTAFPFVGPTEESFVPRVVVNGTLNSCYFLVSEADWEDVYFYAPNSQNHNETPENKIATGLNFDDFATHDNFIDFDLSLVYSTARYEDMTTYNYVDGYTWVIVEGKPVIVSTLINTISQQDYQGKQKNYQSEDYIYYNLSNYGSLHSEEQTIGLDRGQTLTNYYQENSTGEYLESQIIFSTLRDDNENTITYNFRAHDEFDSLTIICNITTNEDGDEVIEFVSAEYGDGTILDIRNNVGDSYFDSDDNFRANDTIVIQVNEDTNEIERITYKVLESASYYYSSNSPGISDVLGSRTNPKIIYNYESFCSLLTETASNTTDNTFYRIVRDIDLDYQFVSTAHSTFKGILQGNYMTIDNLSISYFNNVVAGSGLNEEAFGLFASIETSNNNTNLDTVISNLTINVEQVLSNAHMYVGALAGKIEASKNQSLQKVFLNNISVQSKDNERSYINGRNAVGGLVGIATGNVIIKDIVSNVSVNATYDVTSNSYSTMLYIDKENSGSSRISYAGGVVGIFDVKRVIDSATQRNYNASNLTVSGDNSFVGNIAGSVFGLVGENAIVNYINTQVSDLPTTFIKATSYAGGLIGENRGILISSSITYEDEDNSMELVGQSNYTKNDYFFSGLGGEVIAIGGLVGLNNGGLIANSISTINVRNRLANISGGLVGRMVEGGLVNAITTGSVLSGSFVGGLIGSLNDIDIMTNEGQYNIDALISFDIEKYTEFYGSAAIGEGKTTIISNCIAGNNWLVEDYSYYVSLIEVRDGTVGGFIGLISYFSENNNYSNNIDNEILFEKPSFYANTLYTATNSSTPAYYLEATYLSTQFDNVDVNGAETTILVDSAGNQVVFPYSTSEFYYESSQPNVVYSVLSANNDDFANSSTEHDLYASRIYTILSTTPEELINSDDFYTLIDYDENGNWATPYKERSYTWYYNRFGRFYYKSGDEYIYIEDETTFNNIYKKDDGSFLEIYYIASPILSNFEFTKEYSTSTDSIYVFGGEITGAKLNGYTFESLTELKAQKFITVNGIRISIDLSDAEHTVINEDYDEITGIFNSGTYEYSNCNLSLVNGGKITKIEFSIKTLTRYDTLYYYVDNIVLHYEYNNVAYNGLDNENVFVSLESTTQNAITNYELDITSKRVIYSSFNNGYWDFDENFLESSFEDVSKYPTNLERAEKYIWSDFRASSVSVNIFTAEDLAAFAYMVNNGNDYEGLVVNLERDIDLSGKYWVPIGTKDYPFRGVFNGNNHSIKYVSVNENSLKNNSNLSLPTYAGLFGYVEDAIIANVNIQGGEVSGQYAGGLVAVAVDSIIFNIVNRNNSLGVIASGGIVGQMLKSEDFANTSMLFASYNYARVEGTNSSTRKSEDVYLGGIVGSASDTIFGLKNSVIEDLITSANTSGNDELVSMLQGYSTTQAYNNNFGEVYVANSRTSYITNYLVNIYAGGLIGYANNVEFISQHENQGSISISTNADKVYVGGGVGYISNYNIVENLKNNGEITFTYTNTFSNTELDSNNYDNFAVGDIGGVFGYSDVNVSLSSNSGNITINTITSSDSKISVGGIVGRLVAQREGGISIQQSYNASELVVSSTNNTTLGIGGIAGVADLTYFAGDFDSNVSEALRDKVYIHDSYNSGSISSSNNCQTYLGGILGYAFGSVGQANRVVLQNCLNVGYVTIYNILRGQNALGAIVGVSDFIYKSNPNANTETDNPNEFIPLELSNFYLRGTAYSGNTIYTAMSEYGASTTIYEAVDDEDTFALARISASLKQMSNYELSNQTQFDEINYAWDFDNIWVQEYDTWYPTLRNNRTTSYWVDNQEEVTRAGGYYNISTAEELAYIADAINSGEIETRYVTFRLTNFIDLSNKFWTPIGTKDYPFRGTFDGNGYEIKNLTIDGNVLSSNEYGGLFGVVENAVITSVGLSAPIIQNVLYAGSFVASATNTKLSSLYTESEDSLSSVIQGTNGAGGIVYELINSNNNTGNNKTGLYFSYNNVPVSTNPNMDVTSRIGGLVGDLVNSYISNSYNGYLGIVTIRSINDSASGAVVIGRADQDSRIVNVFNLSPVLKSIVGAQETTQDPLIYQISRNDDGVIVQATNIEPLFDNLSSSSEGSVNDIWTKEYSLNQAEVSAYPTLRSLGREWKNTESEALLGFSTTSATFNTVKETIYNEVENMTKEYDEEGNLINPNQENKIDKTLVNFANDNFNNITVRTIYLISSEEELVWLANSVNNGSLLTTNCEFILLSDLDLSGSYWTPIGVSSVYPFSGIFNFNGHVIKGLTIDSTDLTYAGLFGYTKNAYIINGYVENAFIKVNNNNLNSEVYLGTLTGFADNTTIRNMVVSTNLSGSSRAASFVGGIAGYMKGSGLYMVNNVRVYAPENSIDLGDYSSMVVEVVDDLGQEIGTIRSDSIHIAGFSREGRVFVGGVIGYIVGYSQTTEYNLVEYAFNESGVAGVSLSASSNVYAGGIVGYGAEFLTINASSNTGIVKTYSAKFDIAGGIVGYSNNGSITNCSFDGYIESRQAEGRTFEAEQNIRSYVGGIVGAVEGGYIANCVMINGSTVSNQQNSDVSVGGIIGYARNKNFGNDGISVYNSNGTNGFEQAVGIYTFDMGDQSVDTSSIYLTELSAIVVENGFEEDYWDNQTLLSTKIFIVGSGDSSFNATAPDSKPLIGGGADIEPGLYVSSLSDLILEYTGVGGDKIGIAVISSDADGWNYEYIEAEIIVNAEEGATEIRPIQYLASLDISNIIACYITHISE